jgi:ribosomal protein S18 acetylase RimI-like enzyme
VPVVVIRAGSAADAAQIAAVQREGWFAAYSGIIPAAIIDRVTTPDGGARVRQTFRTRPWQRMIVAVTGDVDPRTTGPRAGDPSDGTPSAETPSAVPQGGIVGYASYGPETDVLSAPWPHPRTPGGEQGRTGELYALYVRPAWWSTGTGRALMERVLARTAAAGYQSVVLWVLRDNWRARRFYERAGFAPDGATNVLERLGEVPEVRYRRPPVSNDQPL